MLKALIELWRQWKEQRDALKNVIGVVKADDIMIFLDEDQLREYLEEHAPDHPVQ